MEGWVTLRGNQVSSHCVGVREGETSLALR